MPNPDYYCACGDALREGHECDHTRRSRLFWERVFGPARPQTYKLLDFLYTAPQKEPVTKVKSEVGWDANGSPVEDV